MGDTGRGLVKRFADAIATAIVSIPVLMCALERSLRPMGEGVFAFWGQVLAVAPGLPGVFLRRAYYRQTLEHCDRRVFIGFGVLFAQRNTIVEEDVYIGPYALIGCACLRRGCLVGSRVSVLSGGALHERTADGRWTPFDRARLQRVEVGEHAWIGEGAILMADVGRGAMVAAGSVAAGAVRENTLVAGNPSRFVRSLEAVTAEAVNG